MKSVSFRECSTLDDLSYRFNVVVFDFLSEAAVDGALFNMEFGEGFDGGANIELEDRLCA